MIAVLLVAIAAALSGSARAAWPGYDGSIFFFGTDSAVYGVSPDGSGLHQLYGPTVSQLGPADDAAWSEDGTKFAYSLPAGDGHEDRDIHVYGHSVLETWGESDLGSATRPAWSPDATRIMFICQRDPNTPGSTVPTGICTSPARGGTIAVAVAGTFNAFAWSPDGRKIAYADTGHVYVADTDGNNQHVVSSARLTDLDWSPTGNSLIGVDGSGRVVVLDVSSGSRTVVADHGGYPTWSPDGKSIAYDAPVGASTGIFVANADGSGAHAVVDTTTKANIYGYDPRWQLGPKPSPPAVASRPTISGTAKEGSTLTAAPGSWNGDPPMSYAYQWQRCDTTGGACTSIPSATAGTYIAAKADVGATLRVDVTATNKAGSASSGSDATGVVVPLNAAPTVQHAHAKWSHGSVVLSLSVCDDAATPVSIYVTDWNAVSGKAVGKHARNWSQPGAPGCRSSVHAWRAVHRTGAPHRIVVRVRDAQGAWSSSVLLSLR